MSNAVFTQMQLNKYANALVSWKDKVKWTYDNYPVAVSYDSCLMLIIEKKLLDRSLKHNEIATIKRWGRYFRQYYPELYQRHHVKQKEDQAYQVVWKYLTKR